ncbi:ATP-dependent zinc protease family protein [Novilysobacter erysipheiresistens]|uniref:RimK/LysX family protein n=1 Tax=Novilysobacter erysipheiresistens TaxID=1749332 RepID=A0ABU7Z1R9_9GAMM
MSASPSSPLVALGWREWVALPGLRIAAIRAKVDSGARTSALHVDAQWRFVEAGAPWVGFRLTPGENAATIECASAIVDEREVTDSGGHTSLRAFVRTPLRVAGVEREIDINLTDRHGMAFPMLLGRSAMARVFTVDPARSFLHGRVAAATGTPPVTPRT